MLFCLHRPQTNLQSMYRTTKHYTPLPTDANSGSLMASKLKKNLSNTFLIKSYLLWFLCFVYSMRKASRRNLAFKTFFHLFPIFLKDILNPACPIGFQLFPHYEWLTVIHVVPLIISCEGPFINRLLPPVQAHRQAQSGYAGTPNSKTNWC